MRVWFLTGLMCAAGALASCGFGHNSGSEVKDTPSSGGVTQVNPKAFNAFNIWRDGQGAEILDYPQDYGVWAPISPDGVFFVSRNEYWQPRKFVGVPTEGAKVVNDLLEYPVQNGRQLKLQFAKISEDTMFHPYAVTYCKNQGLRLPTIRELFDFCAAGVTEPNYGPNFERGRYPSTARCGGSHLWSASIDAAYRYFAWQFDIFDGNIFPQKRIDTDNAYPAGVRCVGSAE
jgi:hypothetical protein